MNYFNQNKKQNNDIRKSSIAPMEEYFINHAEYREFCKKKQENIQKMSC